VVAPEPLPSQRHRFDIPDGVAYLNCAYFSPKPRSVLDAGARAIASLAHPWAVEPRHFFDGPETLRDAFGQLVNGDSDGVALVPSVSYAVGVAAANLEVGPGRSVVLVREQFSSDVYPWQSKVAVEGGTIVTAEWLGEGDWTESVLGAIDHTTAVVCVPNVHWADGRAFDLVRIGEAVRAVGAALVVDASQSLGAVPFDVAAVQPDYLISVGYKWQFGPFSYSYMWIAPEHRNGVPLEATWIGRKGSEDFTRLVDYTDEFQPGARRFDVGEFSNFQLVPMAIAALEFLSELEPGRIGATIRPLTDRVETGCREMGLDPIASLDRHPHLIGVRFPRGIPDGLRDRLAADSIYVSIRGNAVRVGPNIYNTMDDIERLLVAFESAVGG
jgi:selenocysteine lyase/cysteine desulfurase